MERRIDVQLERQIDGTVCVFCCLFFHVRLFREIPVICCYFGGIYSFFVKLLWLYCSLSNKQISVASYPSLCFSLLLFCSDGRFSRWSCFPFRCFSRVVLRSLQYVLYVPVIFWFFHRLLVAFTQSPRNVHVFFS